MALYRPCANKSRHFRTSTPISPRCPKTASRFHPRSRYAAVRRYDRKLPQNPLLHCNLNAWQTGHAAPVLGRPAGCRSPPGVCISRIPHQLKAWVLQESKPLRDARLVEKMLERLGESVLPRWNWPPGDDADLLEPGGSAEAFRCLRIGYPPVRRVVVEFSARDEFTDRPVFQSGNLHGVCLDHRQAARSRYFEQRRIALSGSSMW